MSLNAANLVEVGDGNSQGVAIASKLTAVTGAIEVGTSSTSLSYVDMHSSLTPADYDVRILCSGGTSTAGNGVLSITGLRIDLSATAEVSWGGTLRPSADNAQAFGRADRRVTEVFAVNGAINTSDEREKAFSDIADAERAAALEIKGSIRKFKWLDAIDKKGNQARYHFGVGAQTVGEILQKHGLDPHDYGFFCFDEWDAVEAKPAVLGDDGEVVAPAETGSPAGNRYGIRYEELTMFILAAM